MISCVVGMMLVELVNEMFLMYVKVFFEFNCSKFEFMGFVQYCSGVEYYCNNFEFLKVLYKVVVQGFGYDYFFIYQVLLEN